MAQALQAPFYDRPLEELFACVLPHLPPADRVMLRNVCAPLRKLANGSCTRLVFSSSSLFYTLAASQLLQRFPRVSSLEFVFCSPQEIKAATMFILTTQSGQGKHLTKLVYGENRIAALQLHQQQQYGSQSCSYGQPESRFQQYGYNSGARASPQTLDMTESILATVCSCPNVTSVSVDKTALLDTEAAALARMTTLQELRMTTNSSAQPLRRPLMQLILDSLTQLRALKLSYIRDTTADVAKSLPRLTKLTKLTFQYAYWGESGAGERIMAALAKHQKQLAELQLYECGVSDDMLRLIMGVTSLRRLSVQDEDAEEENCPTNKGLARITQLRRLEQLELFGEELQLDGELLGLLAQLPALRHLAMAGLDSLQVDDADSPAAFEGADDLDAEVEDMDLSRTLGDDETEESFSGMSMGGDEATSRPQLSVRTRATAVALDSRCQAGSSTSPAPQRVAPRLQQPSIHRGAAVANAHRGTDAAANTTPSSFAHQQISLSPRGGGGCSSVPAPLQVLKHLQTLRLYGPSSLGTSPPPLALLLPQPQLRHLKLSACASHANLRALSQQAGLQKLIVSHTNVLQLYPPPGAAPPPHLPLSGASILGFHSEVAMGLASLHVLRIKDLPGLADCHLADLAAILCRLPDLVELKLRALGMVTDAGLAALTTVVQLRRLKLYALGDGVTEAGVAHLAASLPGLVEIKVKDCSRVSPTLRSTIATYRGAAAGSAGAGLVRPASSPGMLVVRYGVECELSRGPIL